MVSAELRGDVAAEQAVARRLSRIEAAIASISTALTGQAFQDDRESKFEAEGHLKSVLASELTPVQQQRLEFAQSIVNSLRLPVAAPVTVKAAASLPQSSFACAAYGKSYWYESRTCTLFIRQQRFDNAADLASLVLHACAHIQAMNTPGSVAPLDDASVSFAQSFHRVIGSWANAGSSSHSMPAASRRITSEDSRPTLSPVVEEDDATPRGK